MIFTDLNVSINSLKKLFLLFIIIVLITLYIKSLIKRLKIKRIGYLGEKEVRKYLRKLERKGYAVLNDLSLPLYDRITQIDHVVIAPTGITVIETKNYKGRISGSSQNKYWVQTIGTEHHRFYNPLRQNHTHANTIKYLLHKEGIYEFSIQNLIVFTSKRVYLQLEDEFYLPVIPYKRLKRWFKSKKRAPVTTDVEKVLEVLDKYRITDSRDRKKHIRYVKKKKLLTKLGI
jgi:hypothetical protein